MKKKKLIYIFCFFINIFFALKLYIYFIKIVQDKELRIMKFESYFNLYDKWLTLKLEKKSISDVILKNGYKSIAIYGMGKLGNKLYQELAESECEVKYVLDGKKDLTNNHQLSVEDDLPQVDAIIVTPIYEFHEIEKQLKSKIQCPIVSLEKIIYCV